MHILCWTVPSICQRTAEQQPLHMSGFLRVIYAILNASVILERNETRLARNEKRLARNEARLARNETRGGNLLLSGTVASKPRIKIVLSFNHSYFNRMQVKFTPSSGHVLTKNPLTRNNTSSPSSLYEPHKQHNRAPNYKGLYGIFYKISMEVVYK